MSYSTAWNQIVDYCHSKTGYTPSGSVVRPIRQVNIIDSLPPIVIDEIPCQPRFIGRIKVSRDQITIKCNKTVKERLSSFTQLISAYIIKKFPNRVALQGRLIEKQGKYSVCMVSGGKQVFKFDEADPWDPEILRGFSEWHQP